jgi:hypothetical protein
VSVKLNHKERGGKLDLKIIVNFVDRLKLLEGLVSETKHIVLFIELPKQYSWCIFRLIWCDFFVAFALEVVTSGDVCGLIEGGATIDKRLEILHIYFNINNFI